MSQQNYSYRQTQTQVFIIRIPLCLTGHIFFLNDGFAAGHCHKCQILTISSFQVGLRHGNKLSTVILWHDVSFGGCCSFLNKWIHLARWLQKLLWKRQKHTLGMYVCVIPSVFFMWVVCSIRWCVPDLLNCQLSGDIFDQMLFLLKRSSCLFLFLHHNGKQRKRMECLFFSSSTTLNAESP